MIVFIIIAVIFWGVYFFGLIGTLIIESIKQSDIKTSQSEILDNSLEKSYQKK